MRIIEPYFEILDELDGKKMLQKIERIGRVCYKSEDLITEDSAEKFIRNILKRGHESVIEHEKISVKMVCDRGVTHEIVRHRDASFAQESTRYCNYSKEKYGSEIQFINPCFYPENSTMRQLWEESCANSENSYIEMTQNHCEPAQQARTVLTNSTKSELFMTARIGEWQHFLKMRATKDAHPQMREVAVPLLQEFIEKDAMMFHGVQNWLERKGKM